MYFPYTVHGVLELRSALTAGAGRALLERDTGSREVTSGNSV